MSSKFRIRSWLLFVFIAVLVERASAKNHTLWLENDPRRLIEFTNFGFLDNGQLKITLVNFTLPKSFAIQNLGDHDIGFTLSRGLDRREYTTAQVMEECPLRKAANRIETAQVVYFYMAFNKGKLYIKRPETLKYLTICGTAKGCYPVATNSNTSASSGHYRRKRSVQDSLVGTVLSDNGELSVEPPTVQSKENTVSSKPDKTSINQKNTKPDKTSVDQKMTKPDEKSDEDAYTEEYGETSTEAPSKEKSSTSGRVGQFKQVPMARQSNVPDEVGVTSGKTVHTKLNEQPALDSNGHFSVPISRKEPFMPGDVSEETNDNENLQMADSLVEELPLIQDPKTGVWTTQFVVKFLREDEEGLYVLTFHNCYNYKLQFSKLLHLSMETHMEEKNGDSYLPAGDIVKPNLYFALSVLFLFTALVWVSIVHSKGDQEVYRVHYLMTALVIIKCLSLFFHGINYYFIGKYGHQREVWAVIYYVMHLLKGALLFGVIILIGTGYTFFKNFLTDRDRRLFMMVLPLQVLDNIAMVIVLETEEGSANYRFWMQLFIFIDLACCISIIIPVVWSIRHLQEASRTDGKAAFNLDKLKLFRHFYILVITYIYVTRVIGMLVAITAPFKYGWLEVVVQECGTFLFFVISGYKFRPQRNNPYLKLSQSDDEMEMSVTQSGVLEGITRLNRPSANAKRASTLSTALGIESDTDDSHEDGDDVLFIARGAQTTKTPGAVRATIGGKNAPTDGSGPEVY